MVQCHKVRDCNTLIKRNIHYYNIPFIANPKSSILCNGISYDSLNRKITAIPICTGSTRRVHWNVKSNTNKNEVGVLRYQYTHFVLIFDFGGEGEVILHLQYLKLYCPKEFVIRDSTFACAVILCSFPFINICMLTSLLAKLLKQIYNKNLFVNVLFLVLNLVKVMRPFHTSCHNPCLHFLFTASPGEF